MDVISPELALIDETLAEAARRWLPPPSDCLAPRTPTETPSPASSLQEAPPGLGRRRARPSLVVVVATLLVAGIVASPAIDLVRTGSSDGARALAGPDATAAGLRRDGEATTLSWKALPGAVAYRLVVRDRQGVVLMLRPIASHVALSLDAGDGSKALAAGAYRWTVAPIMRNGSGSLRIGSVSQSGVLVIAT